MATTEGPTRAHDRHGRRRPFSNWMKRLANLKNPSSDTPETSNKRTTIPMTKRKSNIVKNNPYPISGRVDDSQPRGDGHLSSSTPLSGQSDTFASPSPSRNSLPASSDGPRASTTGTKSGAPTLSTTGETAFSDAAYSKAGTSATAGGATHGGGEGSTFSSPAPSVRSLTTTLTTVQSAAASTQLQTANTTTHGQSGLTPTQTTASQFSHQFPIASPASAVPPHLVPHGGHPTTYNSATANNLLTDNASILTLASSSKRRRRNSLDTNASVRALAPSSLFGGSRESLPLSLLSSNIIEPSTSASAMQRPSIGVASAERASIYSASGVIPAIPSERNSYYASKTAATGGDGASVRSGLLGHGRNDSVTGSIGGAGSPLASPIPGAPARGPSRRSSGWGEVPGEEDDEDEEQDEVKSELGKTKTGEEKET